MVSVVKVNDTTLPELMEELSQKAESAIAMR